MLMSATQTHRDVSLKTALGADVLVFKRMVASEELGRLSEFRIEMASEKLDIKIADILGTDLTVTLNLFDAGKRHYHGIVTRFTYLGWRDGAPAYEAIVHPALWLLTRSTNCRIFQDKTAIDIVKEVCAGSAYAGLIALDVGALSGTPASRPYCVQYRETDFNFVSRLLEEEGIYYFFQHRDGAHTVVLADSYGAHAPASGYASIVFRDEAELRDPLEEVVTRFLPGGTIQPSACALNDFDFEKASASATGGLLVKNTIAAAFSQQSFEHYDYPGLYRTSAVGNAFARARMEVLHGQCERIDASARARGLATGALFTLVEHPRADQNREFLVTSSQTTIAAVDYSSGGSTASTHGSTEFRCDFTAVGKEHSYRAPPAAKKPFVQGPQTAMVVGKAGEEIWTDKYGRIKVQFHWDRDGKSDETSSCWVRVAQGWAGKGWGMMFIPRIGMEVVVDFLEGDPDQPLVTGCVYNGDAMPPYALPGEQTKSTVKSNSSKGGDGYNEIRFEDKKGAEEVYVQAERDFNRVVKNNDTLKVGFEVKDKGDRTVDIHNDQKVSIGHDLTTTVGNDESRTVTANQTVKIDGAQDISVARTIVIEAGSSMLLKVGGSSIKLEPGQITIQAAQVAVQGDAAAEFKSSGMVTIQGSLVKIN